MQDLAKVKIGVVALEVNCAYRTRTELPLFTLEQTLQMLCVFDH